MKKEPAYINYLLFIWALFLIVAVALTLTNTTIEKSTVYDMQIEASKLTLEAYDEIKKEKNRLNIEMASKDIYQSGLLGESHSGIQTTMGSLEAKRTSINPNFAAVFIDMYKEAGLKEGDEIAIVLSGSFPALNISAMISCQVYGLKPCVMASIGASSYGANNPLFTYFDMAQYLYEKNIITNQIDYVSLGGSGDIGEGFWQESKDAIIERIEKSGVNYIYEPDFQTNIEKRTKLILEKCPQIKLLLNVGGNLVSMGKDEAGFINKNGLISPSYLNNPKNSDKSKIGLLDTFLNMGIPVIQMLNIKGLAVKYGLPYDPASLPSVGSGSVYYEENYNLVFPIIAIVLSIGLLCLYYIYRKKLL